MSEDALAVRLLAIFIDELDEQVQQLNDDLLALERAPADVERLRAVFRVMHTLKGASRAAGLPLIEQVCHTLESELSRVRDGASPLGGAQIALLFEAADALGESRDRLRAAEPLPDAALMSVLQRARGRAGAPLQVRQAPVVAAALPLAPSTPSTPSGPSSSSAPAALEPVEEAAPAARAIRVTLQQVDAIAGAAGEIAGLAAGLGDRAEALAQLRTRRRAAGRHSAEDDALDQELTSLVRSAGEDARALSSVSGRLGASARHLRQRPFSELTETLPRVIRDVAAAVGKEVRVVIGGGEIEADRVVLEAMREPLLHLVRNAVDHGLESPSQRTLVGKPAEGEVRIEASLRGDRLQVAVTDDGAGLDLAAVRRGVTRRGGVAAEDDGALARSIFDEGFSTRDTATTLSGRGVGMGIVRAAAERLGGAVSIATTAGKGTTITIDVPVSIATMRVVLVEVGGAMLGLPSAFVQRVGRVDPHKLGRVDGRAMLVSIEEPTPIISLAALLGPPFVEAPLTSSSMLQLVVLESASRRLAIVVDDLVDERELVLRPLEHAGRDATNITVGTALLGTGVVALVLSVPALMAHADGSRATSFTSLDAEREGPRAPSRILVVDDSITSRTLEQSVLAAAGYDVVTAVDGLEGWRTLERQEFALVVSDVEMPHLDGFGLCERIRASERTAKLPVILVTSLDEPAQRARGLEAGADAYITKGSFDRDTLLDTVRMLIGQSS